QNKKNIIGILVIFVLSACVLILPKSLGVDLDLSVSFSVIVLLSVYVILSFEIVHRTAIALLGAAIILIIGISTNLFSAQESFEFAVNSIDFNTIGLLLGMMIIVAILAETGIFQYVAVRASKASKANLWKLMLMLCTFTAVTSMFIDNVTTILLMVPVTISVFRVFKVSPIPFILAQVLASNVGGAATLIGDPPNIMIGSAANIDFSSFIIHMGPTIFVSFIVSLVLLRILFRKDLRSQVHNFEELQKEDEKKLVKDKVLLKKSIVVLLLVVGLFVIHGSLHLEPSVIALGGAALLMVITKARPERVFHEVDWSTLIFFTGLFIIVGAAEHAGTIELLSSTALSITGGDPWFTLIMVIWLSALASAFVDNIPFTATMIPMIQTLNADPTIAGTFGNFQFSPLWWALSLGANLGGNGTLIGSSAGVVAAGLAEKNGYLITFNRFFRIGFPFMLSSVAIGTLILIIDVLLKLQ
ncbi:MAG: ArsB/NhaD family transporter, partial [Nitrososphaeraceae archaeon]|nr:ArsB/NhaD family transporter [Nitrososphaeraceae archaeon]MDW0333808.1 ArsB/NhaD family transporter [Nitrososphaeraceae archaeon]